MGTIQTVPSKVTEVQKLIDSMKSRMADVLPKHVTPERMVRLCRQIVSRNQKLAECTSISLVDGIMGCSILGLEPNGPLGHAYLVPFKNNRNNTVEVTMIVGYQGYIELAYRSGKVGSIWSEIVYSNDHFVRELGTKHSIDHRPAEGNRGEMIGVYAVAEIMGGGKPWVYLTRDEVMRAKASSRGADSDKSPWNNPDQEPDMWRKTAVRRLQKYIPKSIEMARADQAEYRAEMGDRQFIDAEIVSGTSVAASDLAERVERAKAAQSRKPPAPAPTPEPEPAPPRPDDMPPLEDPIPFDSGEVPAEEPQSQAEEVPFVPFDSIAKLKFKSVFCTQATIKTIWPRKSEKGPNGFILTDGSVDHRFAWWHDMPDWVGTGIKVAIDKGVVNAAYQGKPQFNIEEWRAA